MAIVNTDGHIYTSVMITKLKFHNEKVKTLS